MPLVSYSPYEDAANLGQGLGNAFSQIALQLPAMKLQQMQMQAMLKKLPYEVALETAEAEAARARAKYTGAETLLAGERMETEKATRPGKVDYQKNRAATEQAHGDLYKAQAENWRNRGVNVPTGDINYPSDGGAPRYGMLNVAPQHQVYAPTGQGSNMAQIAFNPNKTGSPSFSGDVMPRNVFDAAAHIYQSGNAATPDEAMAMAQRMAASAMGTNAPPAQIPPPQGGGKALDASTAKQFLQQAGGDKDKARALAKQAGYNF